MASNESGYICFVDLGRLYSLARAYRVRVRVVCWVGQFVPQGVALLRISHADRIGPAGGRPVSQRLVFGPSRTLQQDVEFGVLQIVEIALKAISPAVNDPSTAINCIDQLSRVMIRFASRQPPESIIYDLPGVVRVEVPWIGYEGLLDTAFDQIREYATTDVAVCLRLLRPWATSPRPRPTPSTARRRPSAASA